MALGALTAAISPIPRITLNHLCKFIRLSSIKRFATGFVKLEEGQPEKVNSIFENWNAQKMHYALANTKKHW
jgi:hypothetical protein